MKIAKISLSQKIPVIWYNTPLSILKEQMRNNNEGMDSESSGYKSPQESRSRKRKENGWKRNSNKRKRNHGEAYVSKKERRARQVKKRMWWTMQT